MYNDRIVLKLAHFLSSANVCSRREGERLILANRVKVDGVICNNPATRVSPSSIVLLDNKTVSLVHDVQLYAYYKPIETLVSREERPNIFELVEPRIGRVFAIGRLDFYSEGLLLLTNCNKLCSQLMHGDYEREYQLELVDRWTIDMTRYVQRTFYIEDIQYQPWIVRQINDRCVIITLTEGKNREIRRTCQYFDVRIITLTRIRYGPYKLSKNQSVGQIVELVVQS